MAFRTDLDAMVLGALQSGGLHGYEISKRINAQGGEAIRLKEGQLYPILHRLENQGSIASEWEQADIAGKPARRVYTITEQGRGQLAVQRADWQNFVRSVENILAPPSRLETQNG